MKAKAMIYRVVVLAACAALSLSLVPSPVKAKNDGNRDRVIIHIGTPAVWSLGQAHYLLAKMQRDNLGLGTVMPDKTALDPNGINATRIQILRTLLDVEAQFDQKIGVQNRASLDEFKDKLARRQDARAELNQKQGELDAADKELKKMREKLAGLQTDYNQIKTERLRAKPDPQDSTKTLPTPPPSDRENTLERDIAVLSKSIDEKQAARTKLNTDVESLKTTAHADVAGPTLNDVQLGNGASLPDTSDLIKSRIKSVVDNMKDPRFAASIALDNFIGMQYEIIAKQLTLLRDEVGPNERIVFLELPSSVYTVACKGDDYVAQVRWEVSEYYDDPYLKSAASQPVENSVSENDGQKYESNVLTEDAQNEAKVMDYIAIRNDAKKPIASRVASYRNNWKPADSSIVRAVDIIPRQSALNVNDVQATTSQKNFLGVMKLLVGFGLRVSYQRQQELYEQYLQQEVFASGFGKGRNAFGWTFGPLPGTKRISPGVRTTYAALVIPRSASLLKLKATGVAFHRTEAPNLAEEETNSSDDDTSNKVAYKNSKHRVFQDNFAIIIPNEGTEQFQVKRILYTPAKKADPVTVVVKGDYFSPQAGILVDGVPLAKSLSLGNTATSSADKDPQSADIHGQYELVSSREIVMKFSMAASYTGTPNITLITPEKSSALNFLHLNINGHIPPTTLRDLVQTEPMFMPDFSLEKQLSDLRADMDPNYRRARLKGIGLRRHAQIWVNNVLLMDSPILADQYVVRQSTVDYELRFKKSDKTPEEYNIRFAQIAIQNLETDELVHKEPAAERPKEAILMNYAPNDKTGKSVVDVRFIHAAAPVCLAEVSPARDGVVLGRVSPEGDNKYRGTFLLTYDDLGGKRVEKTRVSLKVFFGPDCRRPSTWQAKTYDLDLPVRARVTKITVSLSVDEGDDRPVITLEGVNLQRITKVSVGDKVADIIGAAEQGILIIKLPKGMSIKKDVTVQIPLTLETADGVKVSVVATVGKPRPRKSEADGEENGDKPTPKTPEQ